LIINIISVGLSYFFLSILESYWVTVGLGAAFSVSYIVGLFITIWLLKKHIGRLQVSDFAGQHFRLLIASLAGMLPFFAIAFFGDWAYDDASLGLRAIRLALILTGSGLAYLLIAKALKVSEIAGLKDFATSTLRRRRNK
jgi:putative peptidoglycan lipid II flippase